MDRFDAVRVLLAVGLLLCLGACSGSDSNTETGGSFYDQPFDNSQHELLTILGDVANKKRPLDGRWRQTTHTEELPEITEEEVEKLSELQTLPYLQGYVEAPVEKRVTVYEPDIAFDGINGYNSGHAPEAMLMDMNGNVLHKWQYRVEDVWPEVPKTIHSTFWRRVHWYPNGDLLAIFEGIGMLKLDRFSRLQWSYRGGTHHQAFVMPDGRIYTLVRRGQKIERIHPVRAVMPDGIVVLSPEGEVLEEHSILECIENSEFKDMLEYAPPAGDLLHTNSLYVFDGSKSDVSPHFARGNVLISMLKLDALAILDLKKQTVVWAERGGGGGWQKQHDAQLLPNGNMILFDNIGRAGRSRVVEFDPSNRQVKWLYAGLRSTDLFSRTCGLAARLPNGNTLITESDNGRALEVTPDKKLVWEFYNPHRAGQQKLLIATLFEMKRFPPGYFPWLETN